MKLASCTVVSLLKVIEIEVKKVQDRLKKRDISITLDDKAKEFLVDIGFEPEMGARPLRAATVSSQVFVP